MKDVQRMAHHVSDEFVEKIINFYYLLASGLGIEGLLSFKDGILKSMFFMASSTLPIVFANSLSKMNFTSKNTIELAKSYHLFLKEYVKLQKTFSFDKPLEIYAMFDFLLHQGYLSSGKSFGYDAQANVFDITDLYGVDVFKGTAVCRHIGCMLNDIYEYSNLKGNTLTTGTKFLDKDTIINDYQNLFVWKYVENDNCMKSMVEDYIKDWNNQDKFDKDLMPTSFHLINYVVDHCHEYFLDATNSRIFKRNLDNRYILTSDDNKVLYVLDDFYDDYKNKEQTSYSSDEIDVRAIYTLCSANMDIFEKFYKEHQELYDDILVKAGRVRKI